MVSLNHASIVLCTSNKLKCK